MTISRPGTTNRTRSAGTNPPWIRRGMALLLIGSLVAGCATSPTGRSQLQFFPEAQMRSMGVDAFEQMKAEQATIDDGALVAYVDCVAGAIVPHVPEGYGDNGWEVAIFDDEAVNAFALPGGKMGVYTGLLEVAETPDQLATVIGHEIAHVMAEHANERMSTQFATTLGLGALQVAAGDDPQRQELMAVLGLGAQVGIILPFSRLHESEADAIGLNLMARAGFDPRESVALWRNMARAGGAAPPEFLSTHPSRDTRIEDLQKAMPRAMYFYEQAREAGRVPGCERPAMAGADTD